VRGQRPAAALALVAGAATVGIAISTTIAEFPRGVVVLIAAPLALYLGWLGLVHRGVARAAGFGLAALLIGAVVVLLVALSPVRTALVVAGTLVTLGAARAAFRPHVTLRAAAAPRRPVLFYNPRSGGGKAARFDVAGAARARGIRPVELTPGADLETLVRREVADGADGLAMAGGDGSQAIVAAIAAEHGLPYACIPAGTRNHFALDLGVDRNDVVGALDAFVDGGERIVDLATVNDRVFVNNVSLGVYAEAVQRPEYRDAKLRTLLDTAPDALGPGAVPSLHWHASGSDETRDAIAILVSNNRYRLGRAVGSGTRPRVDEGVLGVTVAGPREARRLEQWTVPDFEVDSGAPVAAGIDGEAVRLDPPLRFHARPAALRVRIASSHPGASPSALQPEGPWETVRALGGIALGRDPR
jgi:diacylglycerol kinase family enzyme